MVLSELRATYWGADSIYRLFERAESKLRERQTREAAGIASGISVNVTPLTPESPPKAQSRPEDEDTRVFSDGFYNFNESLWNQHGLDAIMNDNSFSFNHRAFMPEGSEGLKADLGPLDENLRLDYGLNAVLSFEEFNNQCLYMGNQSR